MRNERERPRFGGASFWRYNLRRVNPRRLIALVSPRSVDPRQGQTGSTSTSPARWRPTDAALALAGLHELYAAAFRFRWARDESSAAVLEGALLAFAEDLAEREGWAMTFRRNIGAGVEVTIALVELVRLVLIEEHYSDRVRSAAAKARLFDVHESTWRRRLEVKYELLRCELETWNSVAYRHVARRLEGS